MGFSEKAKEYFFKELGLSNRELSKRMGDYNEVLVSRYMNSDVISPTFLKKIIKYFPEADVNWLISDDNLTDEVNEQGEIYSIDATKKIDKIIAELMELKESLTRV